MKKYKVNINREKISSEEIASRRDFDAVLKTYTGSIAKVKKPFYKTTGFIAGSAAVVTAVIGVWWYTATHSSPKGALTEAGNQPSTEQHITPQGNQPAKENFENTTRQPGNKPFINRPLKNVDIPYSTYNVNAAKGGEFTHPSGSKIKVPSGAFADADGNDVQGKVELRYREFHDPVDFFISGIPMTYDSAGTKYHFESAGMMELQAYQGGKPLKMKKGKEIEIELRSNYDGTKYNLYRLDTNARNWAYQGKDKVKKNKKSEQVTSSDSVSVMSQVIEYVPSETPEAKKLSNEIGEIRKDIARIEREKPQEPRKSNSGRFKFNIEVDPDEFPEIALYKGIVFEVGEENKTFTKDMYKIVWDDAVLTEGTKKGINYKLTLTKGAEKQTFIVYPVLTGKDYETAMNDYKQKFKTYQGLLSKRKADEAEKEKEYQALLKKLEEERKAEQVKWAALQAQQQQWQQVNAVASTTQEVYRVFRVNNFGVWNCDSPYAYPKGNNISASFANASGQPLELWNVQLVDHKRNGIFIYSGEQAYKNFSYDPSSKNMIWAVTQDNKLAIARNPEFSGIPQKGAHTFKMQVADKEFKTAEEVRAYIMANEPK